MENFDNLKRQKDQIILMDKLTNLLSQGPGQRFDSDRALELMRRNGSSVTLNWGEDTGQWECSWITGGKRFTYTSDTASGNAILGVVTQVWRVIANGQYWKEMLTANTDNPA
jgi:hypothetical protein